MDSPFRSSLTLLWGESLRDRVGQDRGIDAVVPILADGVQLAADRGIAVFGRAVMSLLGLQMLYA